MTKSVACRPHVGYNLLAIQVAPRPRKGTIPPVHLKHQPRFCPGGHRAQEGGVMSPDLPTRPSLEHLKKQARQRLRELQVRVPGAQLADAQYAIAREYGFAGWPKLKAHIDATTSTAEPPSRRPTRPGHRLATAEGLRRRTMDSIDTPSAPSERRFSRDGKPASSEVRPSSANTSCSASFTQDRTWRARIHPASRRRSRRSDQPWPAARW